MKEQFTGEFDAEDSNQAIIDNIDTFSEKYGLDYWFNKTWDLN